MALRKDPTVKERLNRRNLRQHTNAAVMSLPEILDSMIKQQRVECEEHLREYVFYQHKLAGIAWILADELESNSGRSSDALERQIQHLEAAASHYRKVQEVEEKYLPFEIRIDRFMRLHWRKNLAETLLMLKSLRAPQSGGGGEGGEGAPAVVFDTGHLFIDRLNEAANGIAAECAEERGVGVSKAVAKLGNCVARLGRKVSTSGDLSTKQLVIAGLRCGRWKKSMGPRAWRTVMRKTTLMKGFGPNSV